MKKNSAMPALLLVIAGPCATGKTTLAKSLAAVLDWPLLAKDSFKELLYEQLGPGDMGWLKKLGVTSFELLWSMADQLARSRVDHIIEYPARTLTF